MSLIQISLVFLEAFVAILFGYEVNAVAAAAASLQVLEPTCQKEAREGMKIT